MYIFNESGRTVVRCSRLAKLFLCLFADQRGLHHAPGILDQQPHQPDDQAQRHNSKAQEAVFDNHRNVQEETGYELPATGGPGTLPYYLTGLALTLGAALWLIIQRKRRTN